MSLPFVIGRMLVPWKKERKKESYFILSLLCLLVAGTPANPTASWTDFTCYPRRGLCFKRLGDNVFEYFDVRQICPQVKASNQAFINTYKHETH